MLLSSSETLQVKRGRDVVYIRDFPSAGSLGSCDQLKQCFSSVAANEVVLVFDQTISLGGALAILQIEFQSKPAMSGYWFFLRIDGVFFLHSSVHFSFSSFKIFALKIVFNDGTLYITSTTTEGTPVFTALVSFRTLSVSRTWAADLVIQQLDEEFCLNSRFQHQCSPNNLTYFFKKIQVTRFN